MAGGGAAVPSVWELMQSLKGKPDGAQPLFRLSEQAEAAVRRRLPNETLDRIERAERDAVAMSPGSGTSSSSSTPRS